MRILNTLACIVLSTFLINCSSEDEVTTTTTAATTVSGVLTGAQAKASALVPDTSSVSAFPLTQELERAAMTTEWSTTGSTYSHGGNFGDSPRVYVLNHGNSDAQNSLMSRLSMVVENLCLFTTALPDADSDGLPDLTAGSTVTLTAAVKDNLSTACGVATAQMPPDDTVVGFSVEDLSSDSASEYERLISFDLDGGSAYKDFFYFTLNATLNRFSYMENQTNDSYAAYEYNASTGIAKFEFSEEAPANYSAHYRGILLEASNLGRFVAVVERNNDLSTAVVSTLEGGGDELHVSYSFDDDANTNDFTDGNACIDSSDFSIATDDTLTCGSITGAAASGFTFDAVTNVTTANILATDETSIIQFSSLTDILTADSAL